MCWRSGWNDDGGGVRVLPSEYGDDSDNFGKGDCGDTGMLSMVMVG